MPGLPSQDYAAREERGRGRERGKKAFPQSCKSGGSAELSWRALEDKEVGTSGIDELFRHFKPVENCEVKTTDMQGLGELKALRKISSVCSGMYLEIV